MIKMRRGRLRRLRSESRYSGSQYRAAAMRKSVYRQPAKQRIVSSLKTVSVLAAGLMVALGGLWFFISFRIGTVMVQGISDPQPVETAVRTYLQKPEFSQNILLLDTGQLAETLARERRAEYARVSATKDWRSRTLTVTVTPRQPVLSWFTRSQYFALDGEGVISGRYEGQPEGIIIVRDESNLPVEPGQKIVPAQFVDFISRLRVELPQKTKLEITGVRVNETTAEVLVDTSGGFYIRFDTTQQLAGQVENVGRILQHVQSKGITVSQYIDVRIAHKAYFR